MKEKFEVMEMGLPAKELDDLKALAEQITKDSGVKTTQSDLFRTAVKLIVDSPEKLGEMFMKLAKEALSGDEDEAKA